MKLCLTLAATLLLLLCASSSDAAVPTLVHDHMCAVTTGPSGTNQVIDHYSCWLLGPTGSLSGNAVFFVLTFSITGTVTVTPSNDKSDSFTTVISRTHTQQAEFSAIYCTKATAGSRKYTFAFTNTGQARNVRASLLEYNNVTSCTATTTHGNDSGAGTSSTSVTAGSFTPATNDLLIQMGVTDNVSSNTSWTVGSQSNITWAIVHEDINVHPLMIQWGQYTTNTAINPTMTMSPAGAFISVAASMPTSSTGTAASGFRISHVLNDNTQDETSGTVTLPFPQMASGATIVISEVNQSTYLISSVADSNSNTYTKIGDGLSQSSGTCLFYAKNITASNANIITLTMTGTSGGNGSTFIVYELDGADTSAPLDTSLGTSGYVSNNGTQSAGSGNPDVTMCSACMTPASGEIVITASEIAQNSATNVTSPGSAVATYSGTTFTPRVVPDFGDENNPWAVGYADGTAETWTYSQDGSNTPGVGVWYWNAAAFKAPSTTATPIKSPLRIIM